MIASRREPFSPSAQRTDRRVEAPPPASPQELDPPLADPAPSERRSQPPEQHRVKTSPPTAPPEASAHAAPAQVIGNVLGRSLFPFVSLALIAGTMLWGPWVTLILTVAWWKVVTRVG